MKKSLVAVLLSLVALTLVAGAAFAGEEFPFSIKVKVDGVEKEVKVTKLDDSLLSKDVVPGAKVPEKFSTLETSEFTGATIGFAVSGDYEINVLAAEGEKLAKVEPTETGEYILGVMSQDVSAGYAFKVNVTINGTEPEKKGNPTAVESVSTKALESAAKKFPEGTKMFGAEAFESELTSADYAAIESYVTNMLYTTPANITEEGAVVFKITLTGIDANRLLSWISLMLGGPVSTPNVKISEVTKSDIPVVFYFDDATGEEIMLNDVTKDPGQTVDVAFAVKAGRQVFAVKDDKAPVSNSPSSGCDMGLLGSLALFAVALLPLCKSR